MENDILEALKDVGYSDFDEIALEKAIEGGPKSVDYTKVIEWLTKELQYLLGLDEHVISISSPDDSSAFQMELSSFLKEVGCNYPDLTTGHVNSRLQTKKNRLLVLDYLLTELKAARMMKVNKPDDSDDLQVKLNESSTANELKNLLMVLKFPKPPANIPISVLFGKVESKVKELLSKAPPSLIGQPMFKAKLTDKQWNQLSDVQKELHEEYKIRRKMLLTRLDVSIQSFEWSERLKAKVGDIENSCKAARNRMSIEPNVRLSDILVARDDLAITEKTSSASVRRKTKCDINYVIIGTVPDRGGRPYEQEPPPPEMPSWQQRPVGGRGGGQMGHGGQMGRGGGQMGRGSGQMGYGSGQAGYSSDQSGNRGGSGSSNFSNYSSTQQPNNRVQAGWNQDYSRDRGGTYQNQGHGYGRQQSGGYQGRDGSQYQSVGGQPPSYNTSYQSSGFSGSGSNYYNNSSNQYGTGSGQGGYQNPSASSNYYKGNPERHGQDRNEGYQSRSNYSGYYQDRGRR